MEDKAIILLSCDHFENDVIRMIKEDIKKTYHFPAEYHQCNTDLSNFYNPGRRQYDANRILKLVSELAPPNSMKTIALLRIDLYIPILTYIFGQAHLNGNTGIVSLYRLRNELYGLERNNALQITRFRKVIIHEMGHTFGLIHCQHPVCVMRSSTYVEDLDQKEIHLCPKCRKALTC